MIWICGCLFAVDVVVVVGGGGVGGGDFDGVFDFQDMRSNCRCRLLRCGSGHADVHGLQHPHPGLLQDLPAVRIPLHSIVSSVTRSLAFFCCYPADLAIATL